MKYFSHFEGEWDITSSDGNEGELIVSRGATGKCHIMRGRQGDNAVDEIFGFDPQTRKWTCTGYSSSGERYKYPLTVPDGDKPKSGDRFAGRSNGMTPDGQVTSDDVLFEIESDDRFVVTVTNGKRGSQRLPDRKLTFTRRK
jgi:hypothetical protein